MKLSYFNYLLKDHEEIISTFNCRVKMITAFKIMDEEGILVATNFRLLFCVLIGNHPHLLQEYDYKYITNINIKDEMYLYGKYNGDPIKISNMQKDEVEKLIHIINNKYFNNILV